MTQIAITIQGGITSSGGNRAEAQPRERGSHRRGHDEEVEDHDNDGRRDSDESHIIQMRDGELAALVSNGRTLKFVK